jgi:ketosteroid isomerase-like protein
MSSSTARSLLETFLGALSRLDLAAMLDCFDQEATVFLPVEHQPLRLQGTGSIGNAFAAVIARVRATGATSMPIDAEDVHVQQWGDTAVATFHLRTEHLSRRTLVLRRRADQWRIVHLHASNAPLDD